MLCARLTGLGDNLRISLGPATAYGSDRQNPNSYSPVIA